MKHKVVATMSCAFWVDDIYAEDFDHTNEAWIEAIHQWDEMTILDETEEPTIIKIEITETKE
jgi:hypothetical protein